MAPDPNDVQAMTDHVLEGLQEGSLRLPDAMLQSLELLAAVAEATHGRLRAGGVPADHPIAKMMEALAFDRGVQDRFLHNPQLVLEDYALAADGDAEPEPVPTEPRPEPAAEPPAAEAAPENGPDDDGAPPKGGANVGFRFTS